MWFWEVMFEDYQKVLRCASPSVGFDTAEEAHEELDDIFDSLYDGIDVDGGAIVEIFVTFRCNP